MKNIPLPQEPEARQLIIKALKTATAAHDKQVRKYTGEPYISHPIAVAELVSTVTDDVSALAAALLHDVIEDTKVTYEDLVTEFGTEIANLVLELTEITTLEDGNRKIRKTIEKDRLAGSSAKAQTIKLADLINNSESIIKYDPNFSVVYLDEMRELVSVLTRGDIVLQAKAKEVLQKSLYVKVAGKEHPLSEVILHMDEELYHINMVGNYKNNQDFVDSYCRSHKIYFNEVFSL